MASYIVQLLIGASLIAFAMPLSRRYNAWTTKVRERQNRAPSPEMLAKNTRIFAWLLRIFGAVLLVLAVLAIFGTRS